jgi:hypothetical protein
MEGTIRVRFSRARAVRLQGERQPLPFHAFEKISGQGDGERAGRARSDGVFRWGSDG